MTRNYIGPTKWEDRVVEESTGTVVVEGVPLDEVNMNNIEDGIQLSHLDVGLAVLFALEQSNSNKLELEKIKKQRLLQGTATITSPASNGYFRAADPFVQVGLSGFPQINAPSYDVSLSLTIGDSGLVGTLEAYDKTQNGFKVKMSGSAPTATFVWTLTNPNV